MSDRAGSLSKRQKKLQVAKDKNLTVGQLWRARQRHNKGKSIGTLRGRQCILIITQRGRERLGTDEVINALELSEGEESDEEEEKPAQPADIQKALAQELEQARETKTARFDVGMPCLSAIESHGDPIALVGKLFRAVATEGPRTTHVDKLIPLQKTCYPNLDEISETVKTLILPGPLGPESEPKTFSVLAKVRGSQDATNLSRSELTNKVASLVDQTRHKVNLTEPEVIIVVEVIKNIAGVSVVSGKEYRELKKFNLRLMSGDSSTTGGDD